jgi:hypothetical protein
MQACHEFVERNSLHRFTLGQVGVDDALDLSKLALGNFT